MPRVDQELRLWAPVADGCADEHGVLAIEVAKKAGLDGRPLQRLVNEGLLVREFRGVYRWAPAPATELQRIALAIRATHGVASHQSAARLWGFDRWDGGVVHVTVPRGRRMPRRPWLVTHTTQRNLRDYTVVRQGVVATKPLWTLLAVAGEPVADRDLGDLFAHLVSKRLVSVAHTARFLARSEIRGAGTGRLRALLADVNGGPAESTAERDLLAMLARAGIERPSTQFPIYHEGRFVARADAAWPRSFVALEVDGYRYHSDPHTFVADRERGNEIVAAGYRLLRTTPTTIRDNPDRLCAELTEALRQGSARALDAAACPATGKPPTGPQSVATSPAATRSRLVDASTETRGSPASAPAGSSLNRPLAAGQRTGSPASAPAGSSLNRPLAAGQTRCVAGAGPSPRRAMVAAGCFSTYAREHA